MNDQIQVHPRIPKSIGDRLSRGMPLRSGANLALVAWPDVVDRSLAEIRGSFSSDQSTLIFASLVGVPLAPETVGRSVVFRAETSDTKLAAVTVAKLRTLTFAQLVALELLAAECRHPMDSESEKRFIERLR